MVTAADTVTPDASFTSPLLAINNHSGLLMREHATIRGVKSSQWGFQDQEKKGIWMEGMMNDQPNRKPCRGRRQRARQRGLHGIGAVRPTPDRTDRANKSTPNSRETEQARVSSGILFGIFRNKRCMCLCIPMRQAKIGWIRS